MVTGLIWWVFGAVPGGGPGYEEVSRRPSRQLWKRGGRSAESGVGEDDEVLELHGGDG
jgi:hypothetical protein